MKKNKIYDEGGRVPVNRVSAVVVGKGFAYKPNKNITQRHWKNLQPTKKVNYKETDLTGLKFGRFTVIGKYGNFGKKKKPRWLVRCTCGDYETRTSRAINNPKNNNDCCDYCRHLIQLKRTDEFLRTGKNKNT